MLVELTILYPFKNLFYPFYFVWLRSVPTQALRTLTAVSL